MIRPVTCVCFLLAGGAGLYVYQVKHRVSLIDHQIEQTVRATEATREQIRLLHAEWTRLSQPDRLQRLAGQFLNLQSTRPSQFTSMADLDVRLPPVPPPPPPQPAVAPPATPAAAAVASAMPAEPPPAAAAPPPTRLDAEAPPARRDTPAPAPSSEARAVARGTQAGNPSVPTARSAPLTPRVHPPIIETAARAAAPIRPIAIVARTALPSPAPRSGSLLGMAQTSAPPAPEPMPMGGGSRGNGNE